MVPANPANEKKRKRYIREIGGNGSVLFALDWKTVDFLYKSGSNSTATPLAIQEPTSPAVVP